MKMNRPILSVKEFLVTLLNKEMGSDPRDPFLNPELDPTPKKRPDSNPETEPSPESEKEKTQ